MIVLGIDPALRHTGWAAVLLVGDSLDVLDCGCVRTRNDKDRRLQADRDLEASQMIARVIAEQLDKWKPAAILAEAYTGSMSARSARTSGLVWGAISATALSHGDVPIRLASPAALKREATGVNNASKKAVAEAVRKRSTWGPTAQISFAAQTVKEAREDINDAVAAVWALRRDEAVRAAQRMHRGNNGH